MINYISSHLKWAKQIFADSEANLFNCKKLDLLINENSNKITFLEKVDAEKSKIYKSFAAKYPSPYAKLMTLKIVNLLVGNFHYMHRHTTIASRPLQLMVDPSNACQLTCPGCLHTSNPAWAAEKKKLWPNGMLSYEQYNNVMQMYGASAFGAVLYNSGEPFLNPLTPQFISMARKHLLFTMISSNLSLPKIDAEAIVKSGLNRMIIAVDGVTQQTYAQYRRSGNLDYVLNNIKALVETKKRLALKTPYLIWQYLTFEHNAHEIDAALELAKQIGVDAILFLTPVDVSADVPSIKVLKSPKEGYHYFTPWHEQVDFLSPTDDDLAGGPEIDRLLNESLVERMKSIGNIDEVSRKGDATCDWLYNNISIDGLGRTSPCCIPPGPDRHLLFGDLQEQQVDPLNSTDFIQARLALPDRRAYLQNPPGAIPHCVNCPTATYSPHGLWRIAEDLPVLDKEGVIPAETARWLTSWG